LRAFLWVTGYYRILILGYADLAFYQMGWQVRKCIPPVKKHPYNSSSPGSPSTGQISIICLWKARSGLGSGDSVLGHHSPASGPLK
jgi:hypothetical protein